MVVAKEKVGACERCVSFEFLDSMLVKGSKVSRAKETCIVRVQSTFGTKKPTDW